jgi:hypothetical protein
MYAIHELIHSFFSISFLESDVLPNEVCIFMAFGKPLDYCYSDGFYLNDESFHISFMFYS